MNDKQTANCVHPREGNSALIDKISGILSFGDLQKIKSNLTKSSFLASTLGKDAHVFLNNPPFVSYSCRFASSSAPKGIATLFFEGEHLNSVRIILVPQPGEASAIDWLSLEYQQEMKEYYPQFLREELGTPPYEYPWGSVAAGVDARTGYIFSYIWVACHRV